MRVFVFSYNRAKYLRNCVHSVMRHMPGFPITIVDDGSDDGAVHRFFDEISGRVQVLDMRALGSSREYLGGLYRNMQHVLESFTADSLGLFIQDDQQIVRDVAEQDTEHWDRFFASYRDYYQIGTTFLKREHVPTAETLEVDHDIGVYFRDPARSRRAHFSAVGLFNLEALREVRWRFEGTEGENDKKMWRHGAKLGLSAYPFMMWLPNAESIKFRKKGWVHRIAEWYMGAGLYPYARMSEAEEKWLWERDPDKLPVAEDILRPEGLSADQEWRFEDVTKSLRLVHRHMKRKKKRRAARVQGGG